MTQQISESELVLSNCRKITDAACITYFSTVPNENHLEEWRGSFILPHHGGTGNRKN